MLKTTQQCWILLRWFAGCTLELNFLCSGSQLKPSFKTKMSGFGDTQNNRSLWPTHISYCPPNQSGLEPGPNYDPCRDHITPILHNLYWLLIKYRIHFKILLTTCKVVNNLASPKLSDLLHHTPTWCLICRYNQTKNHVRQAPNLGWQGLLSCRTLTLEGPIPGDLRQANKPAIFQTGPQNPPLHACIHQLTCFPPFHYSFSF